MLLRLIVLAAVSFVAVHSLLTKPLKLKAGRPLGGLVPKPPKPVDPKLLASGAVSSAHFTQKLDHFNANDTRTWSQLYQINNDAYKAGGPMFVMISGEGPASINWMTYGQWFKNARTYGAIMFQLEHRFYGTSHPTTDASDANLQYLTSRQALADLDAFIKAMQIQYNIQKVIVFGGSYAGNLAAWYRATYDTAIGSIASSAPVTAEVDFTQYLDTVGFAMDYFVPNCSATVQQGFTALQSLVDSKNTAQIDSLFPPCSPALNYNDPYDIDTYYSSLINPWMGAVQYSAPDVADSQAAQMCLTVTDPSNGADPIHRLSYLYKTLQSCTDHDYNSEITALKKTSWDSFYVYEGSRQWIWQTCNEFGYYQSTDSTNQPFGQHVPVAYIEDTECTQVFGQTAAQIQANADTTNSYYKGVKGNEKKVFLPNGSIDPWHNLAIYQAAPDPSDTLGYMTGTSHCYDMGDDISTDPAQLTNVRNQITQQIGQWLA